jgi:hypothetical protein
LDKTFLKKTATGYIATVTHLSEYAAEETPVVNSGASQASPNIIDGTESDATNGRMFNILVVLVLSLLMI